MWNYPNNKKRTYNKQGSTTKSNTKSKYSNKKVKLNNGLTFDSIKEFKFYTTLNNMLKGNVIKSFEMQVSYVLQEAYKMKDTSKKQGFRTMRKITYTADFIVIDNEDNEYVIDVKGFKTEVFKIKQKLFEYKYNKILYCMTQISDLTKLLK
jgi:hypothetical protein